MVLTRLCFLEHDPFRVYVTTAVHPPALVVLSYIPPTARKDEKSIVLVGKGIVFDTGGLQIKTKPTMPGMKRDMGGAAAILSAFGACVRSKKPVSRPLHAILCLAENAVDQTAMRADDILTMYSGKTVEINNTDAEGRLVLGDGVASAVKHLDPQVIIDMATLTGAQGVATGKYFGALYCNDEKLEQLAVASGKESGDLCHPMPYAPEFFKQEYQSAVADMKNSVADRENAQVSCAGQFIGNQIVEWLNKGGRWCHIDMAYPVYDKKDERATGYGVGLLYTMIEKLDQETS
jgi:probable aminopeptidase NPEPL1